MSSRANGSAAESASYRKSLRLVLGFDDPLTVIGLSTLLKGHHEVVAHGRSGSKILDLALSSKADALIIDSNLPEMSGLNVFRTLRSGGCNTPLVLMDRSCDAVTLIEAVRSGISAVIFYQNVEACLLPCLDYVAIGRQWVDPAVLPVVLSQFTRGDSRPKHALTIRELEIACLVADGHTNKVVARRLGISEGTVKSLLHSLFAKTDSRNRIGLVRYVKDHRLI